MPAVYHKPVSGLRFGAVEVLEPIGAGVGGSGRVSRAQWECGCLECGRAFVATYQQIYYGTVYSCGCASRPRWVKPVVDDYSGRVIGRLIVRWHEPGRGWNCLCADCGEERIVRHGRDLESAGRSACKVSAKVAVVPRRIPRSVPVVPVPAVLVVLKSFGTGTPNEGIRNYLQRRGIRPMPAWSDPGDWNGYTLSSPEFPALSASDVANWIAAEFPSQPRVPDRWILSQVRQLVREGTWPDVVSVGGRMLPRIDIPARGALPAPATRVRNH